MKKFFWIPAALVTISFYYSCTKDKTQKPVVSTCAGVDSATNTYNQRIKLILDANCAYVGCHDATFVSGSVNLSTYSDTKTAFQTKTVICAINQGSGCLPMPQSGSKLADSLITYIQCWADNGYPQ